MRYLLQRGVDPFVFFSRFPKFGAFLIANSDLVEITRGANGSDISVSLRGEEVPTALIPSSGERLRLDVWKAFTNPDQRRKRFLKRDNGEVHHFTEPSLHHNDRYWARIIQSEPNAFIEIDFATAQEQSAWMREFLDSLTLPDWIKRGATAPSRGAIRKCPRECLHKRAGELCRRMAAISLYQGHRLGPRVGGATRSSLRTARCRAVHWTRNSLRVADFRYRRTTRIGGGSSASGGCSRRTTGTRTKRRLTS